MWLNNPDLGKSDFLRKSALSASSIHVPVRDHREFAKLTTFLKVVETAMRKGAADARERAMLAWLRSRGTYTNAAELVDSRDFTQGFDRPALPEGSVISERGRWWWCDSCGTPFQTLPQATSHALTHSTDNVGEAQLRTGSTDRAWRPSNAPREFDLNSQPSAFSQIDSNAREQSWRPVSRVAHDELRKSAGASDEDFRIATNFLINTLWPNVSKGKQDAIREHAFKLRREGFTKDAAFHYLRKFAFNRFGV
jgi:hypothetical protein